MEDSFQAYIFHISTQVTLSIASKSDKVLERNPILYHVLTFMMDINLSVTEVNVTSIFQLDLYFVNTSQIINFIQICQLILKLLNENRKCDGKTNGKTDGQHEKLYPYEGIIELKPDQWYVQHTNGQRLLNQEIHDCLLNEEIQMVMTQ